MKKLLLSILLIVGCDNPLQDEFDSLESQVQIQQQYIDSLYTMLDSSSIELNWILLRDKNAKTNSGDGYILWVAGTDLMLTPPGYTLRKIICENYMCVDSTGNLKFGPYSTPNLYTYDLSDSYYSDEDTSYYAVKGNMDLYGGGYYYSDESRIIHNHNNMTVTLFSNRASTSSYHANISDEPIGGIFDINPISSGLEIVDYQIKD